MNALHTNHPTQQQFRSPVRGGSGSPDQPARLSRCEMPRIVSFAKERTLAAGRAIGFGEGGAAKRERLSLVLDMAPGRISRAFSPHYSDTLNDERIALLADEWPAVRALVRLGIGAPAKEAA